MFDINEKSENEKVFGYSNRIVVKQQVFRKVLDIDLISGKYSKEIPKTKNDLNRIIQKITVLCSDFLYHKFEWSSFKGCHIILFCQKDCDICRMCYDDDKHFAYDEARPEYARNICFTEKVKIKIE